MSGLQDDSRLLDPGRYQHRDGTHWCDGLDHPKIQALCLCGACHGRHRRPCVGIETVGAPSREYGHLLDWAKGSCHALLGDPHGCHPGPAAYAKADQQDEWVGTLMDTHSSI